MSSLLIGPASIKGVFVVVIGFGVGSWILQGFAYLVLDWINDIKLSFSGFKGECNLSLFLGEQVSRAKGYCYRIKNVIYTVAMTFAVFSAFPEWFLLNWKMLRRIQKAWIPECLRENLKHHHNLSLAWSLSHTHTHRCVCVYGQVHSLSASAVNDQHGAGLFATIKIKNLELLTPLINLIFPISSS